MPVIPFETAEFRATVVHPPMPQYEALVLLGPEPLTLWEMLISFCVVGTFLASACGVVALLWCVAKVIL